MIPVKARVERMAFEVLAGVPVLGQWVTPRSAKHFVKFGIVGTLGLAVDYAVLITLHELTQWPLGPAGMTWPLAAANTVSFSLAATHNYIFNRLWTFRGQRHRRKRIQYTQFLSVSVVGYMLNQTILLGLVYLGLWYVISKAVATVVVLMWNFTVNKLWTFKEPL